MRGPALSYRRKRRLLIVVVLAALAGAVTGAIVLIPNRNGAPSTPDLQQTLAAPTSTTARAQRTLRPADISPRDRHDMLKTLSLFISTAVTRHHPERSWQVVHPILREGLTRKQWSSGNIPVVPYPANGVDLITFVTYRGNEAMIEVLLEPAHGSTLVRKTFQAELRRLPTRRWAVSSWVPEGVSESQIRANAAGESKAVVAEAAHPQHLSGGWIWIPIGLIVGGLISAPLGLFVFGRVSNRRAEAQFRASSGRGSSR
jgi:hypothetical protein